MAKLVPVRNAASRRRQLPPAADFLSTPLPTGDNNLIFELSDLSEAEEFPSGTALFRQGHQPSVLRVIVTGFVKTLRLEGTSEVLVSLRTEGWVLGLAPALLEQPYSTSGITATRCTLRSIGANALRQQTEISPRLSATLLRLALVQTREDEIRQAEMAVYSAQDRLARALARLASVLGAPRRQGWVELALPITNGELAQLVCITSEHLSRLLARFEASGRLRRRRGVFLLPVAPWQQQLGQDRVGIRS